jgi:hypothetical protein
MLILLAFLQAAALSPPAATAVPAAAAPVAAAPADNTPEPYLPLPGQALVADSPATAEASAGNATPEDIAADSARDLKDNRYYNKPGASRADYDADWQECRLIARGSITPGGRTTVIVYNPAVISPAAASGAGVIGALIASAIEDGKLRRANRRSCLLFRGWRLVEVDGDESARLAALPESEREAQMNRLLGDPTPKGRRILRWTNQFAAPVLAGAAK